MARLSIRGFLNRLFHRPAQPAATPVSNEPRRPRAHTSTKAARPIQRASDIPLELVENSYTPPLTSSKASFRSDGADHHNDQELMPGTVYERWNDEDHYTNRSGDPRIGTHGRGRRAEEAEERG